LKKKNAKYYGIREQLENDIRISRPQLGLKADYKNSRSAAIQLFCISCMGGSRSDAAKCTSYVCPLWPLEFKSSRGNRPENVVPSREQYETMIGDSVSDKQREAGRRLAKNE
jgi:hypothetical protein